MVNVSDPVGVGLVASLAHPGGNVTGGTDFGLDVAAKYVELIHAVIPKATRLAVLMSDNPVHPSQLKAIQDAARGIGLTVLPTLARSADEFEASFASMMRQHAGAMILLGGAPFSTRSQIEKLVALAAKTKLPAMYESRGIVEAGGLLSYAPSTVFKWTRAAHYVARIFKGAAPGDLPVEQPTQLELAVNLKTAKALGLTIPPSLLARADQVIE
jgi:putative ABC transport system substrate-binding protein